MDERPMNDPKEVAARRAIPADRAQELLNKTMVIYGIAVPVHTIGCIRHLMTRDEIEAADRFWTIMPGTASFVDVLRKLSQEQHVDSRA